MPDVGKINFKNSGGFQYEARAVRECLLQGKLGLSLFSKGGVGMVNNVIHFTCNMCPHSLMANPYQRAIFVLREISKIILFEQ